MKRMLLTKGEAISELRVLRDTARATSPRVKARDLALAIFDAFTFSRNLIDAFVIDALTALARSIIQHERSAHERRAYADARGEDAARGTPAFPEFEEICRECPTNYALPGDDPEDTVYVETFDDDWLLLKSGFEYLRKHARGELRHADGLENLYNLCRRLRGKAGETPRDILRRAGFHV
jgi:hypothetical protein